MIIAKIQVNGAIAKTVYRKVIPAGIIGAQVEFDYDEDIWHELHKTVVFKGAVTKDVITDANIVTIPHEVVEKPFFRLSIGVYGVDADGNIVIPTLWENIGAILDAAAPSGDTSADPSLPVWAQIQAMIGNLDELETTARDNLVAAVNEVAQSSGGGGSTVELDTTLTQSGKAADAAAVGDRLSALSEEIANLQTSGLTTAQVKALDGMFKVAAYIKADVSTEYSAFKTAFGIEDSGDTEPEKTLISISATYSGGDVAVGTAVTDLTGIVVTAHYSDGSYATVTGYTLNGTIAEGNNTITVSYGGKTATFTVNGVAESGGGEGTDDGTEWADGVPYVYTLVENEYVGVDNTGGDGIKTYAGWSRTPFLPCKGASEITVAYIDNTQNKLKSSYGVWYDADKKYITNFNQTHIPYTVPTDACFVIFSQDNVVMINIASITPHK